MKLWLGLVLLFLVLVEGVHFRHLATKREQDAAFPDDIVQNVKDFWNENKPTTQKLRNAWNSAVTKARRGEIADEIADEIAENKPDKDALLRMVERMAAGLTPVCVGQTMYTLRCNTQEVPQAADAIVDEEIEEIQEEDDSLPDINQEGFYSLMDIITAANWREIELSEDLLAKIENLFMSEKLWYPMFSHSLYDEFKVPSTDKTDQDVAATEPELLNRMLQMANEKTDEDRKRRANLEDEHLMHFMRQHGKPYASHAYGPKSENSVAADRYGGDEELRALMEGLKEPASQAEGGGYHMTERARERWAGVHSLETYAIYLYTQHAVYDPLNSLLWGLDVFGSSSDVSKDLAEFALLAVVATSGLNKVTTNSLPPPDKEGQNTVYRYSDTDLIPLLTNNVKPDDVFVLRSFISTSAGTHLLGAKTVEWTIHRVTTGVGIWDISSHFAELEVLYRPFTRFRLVSIKKINKRKWKVEVEEANPNDYEGKVFDPQWEFCAAEQKRLARKQRSAK